VVDTWLHASLVYFVGCLCVGASSSMSWRYWHYQYGTVCWYVRSICRSNDAVKYDSEPSISFEKIVLSKSGIAIMIGCGFARLVNP